MTTPGRAGDILLETPVVRAPDIVPAVEDRSYVIFIAGAMFMAIAAGFTLAVVVSLSRAGVFLEERGPWLVQAHGWAQLQGWAGLFVAGMGVRLLPRFAGRRPVSRRINVVIFACLFGGVALRTIAQPFAGDGVADEVFLAAQVLWAAGACVFSALIASFLLRGRGGREPWRIFGFCGAAWWLAWAVLSIAAGLDARDNDTYVSNPLDDSMTWVVMLGAIGSFIWAVQSRSVPIFFGRRVPQLKRVAVPAVLLNAGGALLFVCAWLDAGETEARLGGAGFVLAGAALVWLAPVAGSVWGKPTRLRPRARAAARFVLAANIAAVVAGVLLAWAGARTVAEGELVAQGARDAARHAFGVGLITLLIVGMAQLVAPFFAIQRVESKGKWILDHGILWLLASAAVLRVLSGLLDGQMDLEPRMHLSALAGTLAWLGLVLFAVMVIRAIRSEPRTKAALVAAAQHPRG